MLGENRQSRDEKRAEIFFAAFFLDEQIKILPFTDFDKSDKQTKELISLSFQIESILTRTIRTY